MPTAAAISSTATSAFGVGVGLATSTGFLAASSLAGPIGLAVGLVATLVLSLFGGGCGQTCIAGSKVEQIFEAFADNLLTLVKAGMMSKAQGLVGMNEAIQIGQQSEAQLGTQAAQAGSKNLTKVISAEIADLSQVPDSVPQIPFDPGIQSKFAGGSGWYPDSITQATQLTLQYAQQAGNPPGTSSTPAAAGGASTTVSQAISQVPVWAWGVGAAAIAAAVLL